MSFEREKHVLQLPIFMNQRVGHHHASDVNAVNHMGGDKTCAAQAPLTLAMWCHKTGVKDIQLCIHAVADPERATQTSFNHS